MKSKLYLILFLIAVGCFVFFFLNNDFFDISEEIIFSESGESNVSNQENNFVENNSNSSGELGREYDILVQDDNITFYDKNGNSIIYVFSNDRLENVLNVLAQMAKKTQVFILTCSDREKRILENLKIKYNEIEF